MVEVRAHLPADRTQWLDLRQALWPDSDAAGLGGEIDEYLPTNHKTTAIGAFDSDRLVAFAEASIRPWGEGCDTAPVGWLEAVYVVPERRRSGIARALVAAVESWSRTKGLKELGSDALIENALSIARHAQWGFVETERLVMFRKVLV
ncbi:MAG: GNAT family N-acetyltransferase [Pelagibacterium sp.]|uniref:GNAT family N-acetyltransferase n=1 Tax=Pelagibacterium sp. TaxID=1967288 RepID=UPI0032EBC7C9